MSNPIYSSAINGVGFRLYEFKQVVQLIEDGLTDTEIREKVFADNLFQQKASSTQRSFPSVLKRSKVLDQKLRLLVLNQTNQTAKQVNLFAILKTDRLFFEFLDEVIKYKLQNNDFTYERKDINIFFNEKMDHNEQIEQWSDVTISKIKSAYNRILLEVGYLADLKSSVLNKIYLDTELKEQLINNGDSKYVETMQG